LRLDRIVAGYAIRAFWIGAITLAPSYVSKMTFYIKLSASIAASPDVVAAFAATRATAISMFALASLGSVIALLIVARLSLALPGIALGRDGVTLGSAWRVSKRNT
jgi:hypothetical protein